MTETMNVDTRAGFARVLDNVVTGLAEMYGFTMDDVLSKEVNPWSGDAPEGTFEIFAILYAIQGFLLCDSDDESLQLLSAAAKQLEPIVQFELGTLEPEVLPEN